MDNVAFSLSLENDPVLEEFEQDELEHPTPRKEIDGGRRIIYQSRTMDVPKKIGYPVLCDLGSVASAKENTHDVQPDLYRAPEVILQMPWSCKIDIWNVGCLVWDMFEGSHLFAGTDPERSATNRGGREQLGSIISLLGPPPLEFLARCTVPSKYFNEKGEFDAGVPLPPRRFWEEIETTLQRQGGDKEDRELFLQLMRKMLQWMPEKRSTAAELCKDEWITKNT